jgi:hypothetical protein
MAKIEEIQGRGADERWRAQRVAQKLDIQVSRCEERWRLWTLD